MSFVSIEGHYEKPSGRVVIVAARFNELVVESLIAGANDTLVRHGLDKADIDVVRAPGAYELPLICQRLAKTNRYQGMIALGAVIRGGTPHFDYVAGQCASGLMQVSLEAGLPIMFGVLTTDSIEQAMERAGTKAGNKGADAAFSLLETLNLLERIDGR